MPHITVKMYPGRSDAEKQLLADNLATLLHDTMGYKRESVSVAVVEVEPSRWMQDVYEPEITQGGATLLRRPGYGPSATPSAAD